MKLADVFRNFIERAWPRREHSSPRGRGAGMAVNVDSALAHATVWACVRIISETIATLGWHITRDLPNGERDRVTGTPLDWLLNVQPNPEMTSFTWRELVLVHALMSGNHYSEIQRDAMGRPIWLWPLDPERCWPDRDSTGALIYRYYRQQGGIETLPARNVLHIHGLGWDGLSGYSVISVASRSLGSGIALDEHGANFFRNGAHLGLIFEHPKALSQTAWDRLQASIAERTGPGNSFKTLIAEEGMKPAKFQMSMIDAQFLESRKFQVSEICRWFRVPPHKVADLERATFSNIEHQAIEFVQDTILPWCKRLEQEVDLKLFGVARQGNVHTRLNVDTLLRGDIKSRFEAYGQARQWGWLSVNDIRRLENSNGIGEDGDIYLQPSNMVEAGADPVLPGAPVGATAAAGPTGMSGPTGASGASGASGDGVAARVVSTLETRLRIIGGRPS